MSYQSIVTMASSQSLTVRCAAAAAAAGLQQHPVLWTQQMIWQIVSAPGWDEKWDAALANPSADVNPDTGMRGDVITDEMIADAVGPLVEVTLSDGSTQDGSTPQSSDGGTIIGGVG